MVVSAAAAAADAAADCDYDNGDRHKLAWSLRVCDLKQLAERVVKQGKSFPLFPKSRQHLQSKHARRNVRETSFPEDPSMDPKQFFFEKKEAHNNNN